MEEANEYVTVRGECVEGKWGVTALAFLGRRPASSLYLLHRHHRRHKWQDPVQNENAGFLAARR